jgi:nucleoside-diphosphate-sugar epimerase
MRISCTGEAGQIAQAIFAAAERESWATLAHFGEARARVVSSHHDRPEVDVASGDVVEAIREARPDVVVHCAAITGTDKCDEYAERAISANLLGTQRVLDGCAAVGAKLIYLSTTATYDPMSYRPYVEGSGQRPSTLYGITKYAGELLVRGQRRVPWTVIRPCFLYGDPPLDHASQLCRIAVHEALRRLWPERAGETPVTLLDPRIAKDYMRVEDFARAVVAVLVKGGELDGKIFNVAGGEPRPVGHYFSALGKALGWELDMAWEPGSDYLGEHVVDSGKIRSLTGWEPKVGFDEGIAWLAERAKAYVVSCRERGIDPGYR